MSIPYAEQYVVLLKQENTANRFLIDPDDGTDPYYIALNEAGDDVVKVDP